MYLGEVKIQGNYLLSIDHDNGICLVDISDPTNPVYCCSFSDSSVSFRTLYIRDTVLFAGNYKIYTLNISDSTNLSIISSFDLYGWRSSKKLFVFNNYLFVSINYNSTFHVYDISDLANPSFIVETGSESGDAGIFVRDNYTFVAGWEGFYIYDDTDILNPILLYRDNSTAMVGHDIFVDGNFVYLIDNSVDLRVLDFTDPYRAVERGYYKDLSTIWFAAAKDSFVCVYFSTSMTSGIKVFDVRVPENPILVKND